MSRRYGGLAAGLSVLALAVMPAAAAAATKDYALIARDIVPSGTFVPGLLHYTMAYTNRPSGIQQVLSFFGHAPQDTGR